MGTLSLGNDNVSESERSIFLKYLNRSHEQLFAKTANLNRNLPINEQVANVQDSNDVVLGNSIFSMLKVYVPSLGREGGKLKYKDIFTLIEEDPGLKEKGLPTNYWITGNTIHFYPKQTAVFNTSVWYIPSITLFDLNTQEDEIPYPVEYHRVLADGALWYLFQDAAGFKNPTKEQEAKIRWEDGKAELLSYLYNSEDSLIFTFSNVG